LSGVPDNRCIWTLFCRTMRILAPTIHAAEVSFSSIFGSVLSYFGSIFSAGKCRLSPSIHHAVEKHVFAALPLFRLPIPRPEPREDPPQWILDFPNRRNRFCLSPHVLRNYSCTPVGNRVVWALPRWMDLVARFRSGCTPFFFSPSCSPSAESGKSNGAFFGTARLSLFLFLFSLPSPC